MPILFFVVVASGVQGQKKPYNNLLVSELQDHNAQTSAARFADGVQPMDTIYHIEFATRVDSFFKYREKAPTERWEIVFRDGIVKPDLQTGDILRVTSENGDVKDYFLKLDNYKPATNAYLGSITWPDMPNWFKGEVGASYGWKGDTIPSFDSLTQNYVLILPWEFQKIPALTFSTAHLNSKVAVTRAVSLGGSVAERTITFTVTAEDNIATSVYSVLLKKEENLDNEQKSTVTSKFYKVSGGYSMVETIRGLTPGTTVAGFFANLVKADDLQTLKVKSASDGAELAASDVIRRGDALVVLSADSLNWSKYILEVTAEGLSANTLLTSEIYTVSVAGSTGTISGFPKNTLLKTLLAGVVIPAGATLTAVDKNDAYKILVKLNFDTMYVDVLATSDVYFEVVAENGRSKVLYQLIPTSQSNEAYATSDLYSIDQYNSTIYFISQGTSDGSLLSKVTPVRGATMTVFDKAGFVRSSGILYRDDKLMVTSEDGTTTKVYYFSMPNYWTGPHLAFIVSDDYMINQVALIILVPSPGTDIAEFKSKLYPSFGATIKVIDANGKESTLATLARGDQLLVTSADGTRKAIYRIDYKCNCDTGVDLVDLSSTIRIFPNPTSGPVVVQGLAKGSRLRVLTPAGVTLRDVMVENSADYVSLSDQP